MYTLGRPLPKVTWWKAENELKSASHTSFEKSETVIVNQLLISNLSRDYFGSKFECRAQGTKLVKAVIKEISVQIYCKLQLNIYFVLGNYLILFYK